MRVYDAMCELEADNGGWPVPILSIGVRAGLSSTATVHVHLDALLRAGLVERSPYPRGGYRVNPHRRET